MQWRSISRSTGHLHRVPILSQWASPDNECTLPPTYCLQGRQGRGGPRDKVQGGTPRYSMRRFEGGGWRHKRCFRRCVGQNLVIFPKNSENDIFQQFFFASGKRFCNLKCWKHLKCFQMFSNAIVFGGSGGCGAAQGGGLLANKRLVSKATGLWPSRGRLPLSDHLLLCGACGHHPPHLPPPPGLPFQRAGPAVARHYFFKAKNFRKF